MTKRAPRNYLSNYNLLEQIAISKENKKMSNELLKMLTLLCDRFATRGNFSSYTYLEDMKMNALVNLCNTWGTFNAERSSNPFAYYTQSIKNSFIQYLKVEKKQRNIRDRLLVDCGASPSHTYAIEASMEGNHIVDPALLYIRRDNYEFMNKPPEELSVIDELDAKADADVLVLGEEF
jgi:hypothetical protein